MKFAINWLSILLIAAGILVAAVYPHLEQTKSDNELRKLCVSQKGRIVYTGPAQDKLSCQYDFLPPPETLK